MDIACEVVVATDSDEVANAVTEVGARCVVTPTLCASGTERVAAVARQPEFASHNRFVNVQGDEPFISRAAVTGAMDMLDRFEIGTAAAYAPPTVLANPDVVKVVMADDGRALYFSRAPVPFLRDSDAFDILARGTIQHVGVYAYTRAALLEWVTLPPHPLEEIERLEQLRPLAAGMTIGVAVSAEPPSQGVDTEEDLARANARWRSENPATTAALT